MQPESFLPQETKIIIADRIKTKAEIVFRIKEVFFIDCFLCSPAA